MSVVVAGLLLEGLGFQFADVQLCGVVLLTEVRFIGEDLSGFDDLKLSAIYWWYGCLIL